MTIEELVINLIIAINNQNLEDTKKYVKLINESELQKQNLDSMLDVHNIDLYDLNNKCFEYVLDNLIDLQQQTQVDEVKLYRYRNVLLNNNNAEQIENFILSQLETPTFNVKTQILMQVLIQLAINLKNKEKTQQMLFKIKEQLSREEEM